MYVMFVSPRTPSTIKRSGKPPALHKRQGPPFPRHPGLVRRPGRRPGLPLHHRRQDDIHRASSARMHRATTKSYSGRCPGGRPRPGDFEAHGRGIGGTGTTVARRGTGQAEARPREPAAGGTGPEGRGAGGTVEAAAGNERHPVLSPVYRPHPLIVRGRGRRWRSKKNRPENGKSRRAADSAGFGGMFRRSR